MENKELIREWTEEISWHKARMSFHREGNEFVFLMDLRDDEGPEGDDRHIFESMRAAVVETARCEFIELFDDWFDCVSSGDDPIVGFGPYSNRDEGFSGKSIWMRSAGSLDELERLSRDFIDAFWRLMESERVVFWLGLRLADKLACASEKFDVGEWKATAYVYPEAYGGYRFRLAPFDGLRHSRLKAVMAGEPFREIALAADAVAAAVGGGASALALDIERGDMRDKAFAVYKDGDEIALIWTLKAQALMSYIYIQIERSMGDVYIADLRPRLADELRARLR